MTQRLHKVENKISREGGRFVLFAKNAAEGSKKFASVITDAQNFAVGRFCAVNFGGLLVASSDPEKILAFAAEKGHESIFFSAPSYCRWNSGDLEFCYVDVAPKFSAKGESDLVRTARKENENSFVILMRESPKSFPIGPDPENNPLRVIVATSLFDAIQAAKNWTSANKNLEQEITIIGPRAGFAEW